MPSKRVLVTGAGGFIGRWSVPALQAAGYEVHALLTGTAGREIPPQILSAEIHCADLLDARSTDALMESVRPSHLLHFAWIATPGVYWNSPYNRSWLGASQHLLRRFHAGGGSRAVMAGSCAEYDWSQVGVCHERSSPLANDRGAAVTPYAECKIAMQRALQDFGRTRSLSAAWGRIFFQFGPGEHRERLVASVISNLLSGREAPSSHGRQIRSFLHVADVAGAFVALLDSGVEGPVNIGSAERISIAELLELIARQSGRPDLLRLGARSASAAEPAVLVPDVARLHDEVGWRPGFTLNDAVADTITWWRARLLDVAPATIGGARGGDAPDVQGTVPEAQATAPDSPGSAG
jgi:nucleoside-diphosphate-sugar epimerase